MRFFELLQQILSKNENFALNRKTFKFLAGIVVFFGLMAILNLLFPRFVALVLNIVWILLLTLVFIFFALGILVVLGLRKEAAQILDILLEGSLTFLDLLEFLKLLYRRFIQILQEFLLYVAPVFAYILAGIVYVLLLMLYKTYGRMHDITIFTVVLTAILVIVIGLLNKPKKSLPDLSKWRSKFAKAFKMGFVDGFEVMLFIFFLTMDATNLFFLPEKYNIQLFAQFKDYDLMQKAFIPDGHMKTTINLVVIAITIEIVRNCLKLIAAAKLHYSRDLPLLMEGFNVRKVDRVKTALRKTFADSKDEMVRFITFTTVLFAVFLLFPRLKLLALTVSSIMNLILDFWMRDRLTITTADDLVSRILSKVFRL